MDISFVTKIVCDLCMWFGAAGLILSLFGASDAGLGIVAVLAAGSALATVLKKPPFKFLPVIVILLGGFWIRGLLDCLLIIPPCLYCIYVCVAGANPPEHSQCRKYITIIAPIAFLIIVIIVVCGGLDLLTRVVLPYYVVFLIFGILTLSISRHEEHKRNERRLWLLILTSVASCCAAALIFSSDWFFGVAGSALSFIYSRIILPVVMGLVYLFTGFMWLISSILNIEYLKEQFANREPPQIEAAEMPVTEEVVEIPERPEIVGIIAIIIAVIVFIILAIIIFRYLAGQDQGRKRTGDGVRDLRKRFDVEKSNEPVKFSVRNSRQAVRRSYRKFLHKAQLAGVDIRASSTSTSILNTSRAFFDAQQLEKLREIYIVARYSNREITKTDVKMAKAICSKLKQKT